LLEKALCQIPALPLPEEFHRHLGGGGGVAPGLEVVHTAGLVAFKESRADRPHQGALSGFVGPGKQVDAVVKAIDHQRLAELAELFDANVLNLHGADPGPWASLSSWVRITRASRAVSPWGPCWASRSSVSPSPTKPSARRAAISSSVGSSRRSAVSQVRLRWRASATERAWCRR